jgi:hypothetical protein
MSKRHGLSTQYTDRDELTPACVPETTVIQRPEPKNPRAKRLVPSATAAVSNSGFAGGWFAAAQHDGSGY